ncbi:MAG: S41 family peptidase [Coprothermobacterota bacterium]|nr:S41 family peptidase [Coprothermobacterota bacterium]
MKKTVQSVLLVLLCLALFLVSGCLGGVGTDTTADPRIGFTYPDPADYSALAWTDAFQAAHDKLSHEYAFGDWKGVDWPGLYSRFLPRIAQAQAAGDETAYYLALHEYVCSIPDSHISLAAENTAVLTALGKKLAGGGFGMAAAELDDWRVIVAAVIPEGPADSAGIAAGAEIITWGGQPVKTAIGQIDVGAIPFKALTGAAGNENPKASLEHYRLEQVRLLARGPVGTSVPVVFKNPGSTRSQTATLTAVDDGGQSFSLLNFAARPDLSDQVDYRILPEGYGYVLVRMELDLSNPGGYPTGVYQQFREAITSFVAAGVPGVIIDLRGNYGGSDQLAADMCGFFTLSPAFYEEQEYFDKRNGRFLRITASEVGPDPIVDNISIAPQAPYYGGPVVVLVNPSTTSSGEGPPMGISRLPNGRVLGFHGTNGSFGMTGGEIKMPGGYSIQYPFGRSVDHYGVIQLDSRNGSGGVTPNLRVPKTLENVLAFAAGTDVELQYAVKYLRGY